MDNFIASPSVKAVKVLTADESGNNPGTFKIMVGDWVAQWDSLYSSWFYYNSKTDFSTWDKPMELQHVSLNPPKGFVTQVDDNLTLQFVLFQELSLRGRRVFRKNINRDTKQRRNSLSRVKTISSDSIRRMWRIEVCLVEFWNLWSISTRASLRITWEMSIPTWSRATLLPQLK